MRTIRGILYKQPVRFGLLESRLYENRIFRVLRLPDDSKVAYDVATWRFYDPEPITSGRKIEPHQGALTDLTKYILHHEGPIAPWVRAALDLRITEREYEFCVPQIAFRDAFSRSRTGQSCFYFRSAKGHQFSPWDIQQFFTKPTHGYGGMFSSSLRQMDFLDGGIREISNYGFQHPGGIYVIGTRALRFVCLICSIEQPEKLKEEARVPTLSGLLVEAMSEFFGGSTVQNIGSGDRNQLGAKRELESGNAS